VFFAVRGHFTLLAKLGLSRVLLSQDAKSCPRAAGGAALHRTRPALHFLTEVYGPAIRTRALRRAVKVCR
jgi:hypothetical protein